MKRATLYAMSLWISNEPRCCWQGLRARFQLYHYTIFVGILFAVFTVSGKCTTKKIHISIKRIEGNQIVFTPLTVPEFYGELDGKLDGRIQECTIKKETQGELNGAIVYRAILYCEDAKIKLDEANLE